MGRVCHDLGRERGCVRPPEPRREAARYIAYLRSVQTLFEAQASDAATDGRLTRSELESAWASATAGARSFLDHAAVRIGNDNAAYWRKLAKGRAVPAALQARALREAWVKYNLTLIADIGAKQIEAMLGLPRTDAKHPQGFTTGRNTRLDTPCANCSQRRGTHSDPGLLCPDGSGRKYRKPSARGPEQQPAPVDARRQTNVNLISGQTEAQRKRLTELFAKAQAKGERHETLAERVQEITGAGFKRAKRIARDQTVKHNAVIRQETARSLGITKFIWRDSGDEAVRPYHKKLNGHEFSYAEPPVTDAYGHRNLPGEDYECRCVDDPIVDLFAGLGGQDLSGSLRAQGKLKPRAKRAK